ncbi:MAG: hypothetical protein AB1551_03600 [Actinomycetota bacterium]
MGVRNAVTPEDVGRRVAFQFELPNGDVGEILGILEAFDQAAETYVIRKGDGNLVQVPARGVRFAKVVSA